MHIFLYSLSFDINMYIFKKKKKKIKIKQREKTIKFFFLKIYLYILNNIFIYIFNVIKKLFKYMIYVFIDIKFNLFMYLIEQIFSKV